MQQGGARSGANRSPAWTGGDDIAFVVLHQHPSAGHRQASYRFPLALPEARGLPVEEDDLSCAPPQQAGIQCRGIRHVERREAKRYVVCVEGLVVGLGTLVTVPHEPEFTLPVSLGEICNALFKNGFTRLPGAGEFHDVTGVP